MIVREYFIAIEAGQSCGNKIRKYHVVAKYKSFLPPRLDEVIVNARKKIVESCGEEFDVFGFTSVSKVCSRISIKELKA